MDFVKDVVVGAGSTFSTVTLLWKVLWTEVLTVKLSLVFFLLTGEHGQSFPGFSSYQRITCILRMG